MNCQNYRIQIIDWISGSLVSDESLLEAHLGSCPSCARFHQEQLELSSLLGEPDLELDLPAGIWLAVREQIEQRQATPAGWLDRFREWITLAPSMPAYGLAGLAALILVSVSLFQLPKGPDSAILAQLDSYTLERQWPGNPFLAQTDSENPFLSEEFHTGRGNPFAAGRRP